MKCESWILSYLDYGEVSINVFLKQVLDVDLMLQQQQNPNTSLFKERSHIKIDKAESLSVSCSWYIMSKQMQMYTIFVFGTGRNVEAK